MQVSERLTPNPQTVLRGDKVPIRIQRKRTKGWTQPQEAVYVGRPTQWGNPFRASDVGRAEAVRLFRSMLEDRDQRSRVGYPSDKSIRESLRGKVLMCWCRVGAPCHADVLLEIANQEPL